MARWSARRVAIAGAGAALLGALGVLSSTVCLPAWISSGILVDQCPAGRPRQTLFVEALGLRRGARGPVRVGALAHYSTGAADEALEAPVRRLTASLELVDAAGRSRALGAPDGWREDGGHARTAEVTLPDVPDGDYRLRAHVETPLGRGELDLPLPIYAPARVHVLTDRPLYQPGQTVWFRALALRARDLAPLDGRPGRWVLTDPSGEVLLEERAPAREWGVATGSFPLDAGAASGAWRVRWESGGAADEVTFRVQPFTLPRFRVEASASRPFYRAGEQPALRGQVVYASGAPVAGARCDLDWSIAGAWPPPAEWVADALPRRATTDAAGRFEIALPIVPGDLRGQVTVAARLTAIDPAGDRAAGAAAVLLAEDALALSAVTELGDGLVAGFNNRLYLRATTADGRLLAGADLLVRRGWEPTDRGIRARTDEDGVAALQLDPGPPVNMVIPALPLRPAPRPPAVRRGRTEELLAQREPALGDQRALDDGLAALAPCARFVEVGEVEVTLAARVDASGRVTTTAAGDAPVASCLAAGLRPLRLPPGPERLLRIDYAVQAPDLPRLEAAISGLPGVPAGLEELVARAALDARACLPATAAATELERALVWRTRPEAQAVEVSFVPTGRGGGVAPPVTACVERHLATLRLPQAATVEGLGLVRLGIVAAARAEEPRPQATTLLGYDLDVAATRGGEALGTTRLRLRPGVVPAMRLRATPVVAEAGGEVAIELLRGPGFSGALPERLELRTAKRALTAPLDPRTRTARFRLPRDTQGWIEATWSGARALAYVRPRAELEVAIRPDRERYAPGQTARLALRTTVGGRGTPAALGLVGVDETLGQLAPLPGPEELARVRPRVETPSPAFGTLDGQALTMGRIRGAHAAAATVLRVASVPTPEELDVTITGRSVGAFDPVEALTDHFYGVLSELHARARAWERAAPAGVRIAPSTLAALWREALEACRGRGEPIDDAYGRPLRLAALPPDLLALTDPRQVVVDGTRLPEDVEDWSAWVARERP